MKKIMSLIAAGIITIGLSYAQPGGGQFQNRTPEEMAKMQVERLKESLSLTKAQQDSIYKYTLAISKDQRKLMESAGDNREAAFEKMSSLREANDKKIKSFLTADQIKKYDEMIKNRGQRGGGGNRPNN